MKVVIHCGMVWAYRISGGWYTHIKAFPEAVRKNGKEYVPDIEHASVRLYVAGAS